MQYNRDLKKKLCEGICLNGLSTLKTANEYNVPIKTLEKWVTAFNKDNHCFDPIIETVSDFRLIDESGNVNYEDLDSEELKTIIMKKDIEIDINTGEKVVNLFYCEPNCSWQKGSIEKNHEYIRYVLPKGKSFAGLSQEDCFLLASHINSVPRCSLNNSSPYDSAKLFIGEENIIKLSIKCIDNDEINLTHKLLEK